MRSPPQFAVTLFVYESLKRMGLMEPVTKVLKPADKRENVYHPDDNGGLQASNLNFRKK